MQPPTFPNSSSTAPTTTCANLLASSARYLQRHAETPSPALTTHAINDAKAASQLCPRLPAVWLALFSAHLAANDIQAAHAALSSGLANCPRDHALRFATAGLEKEQQQHPQQKQEDQIPAEPYLTPRNLSPRLPPSRIIHRSTSTPAHIHTPSPSPRTPISLRTLPSLPSQPVDQIPQPASLPLLTPHRPRRPPSDAPLLSLADRALSLSSYQHAITHYTTVISRNTRHPTTPTNLRALRGRSEAWLRKALQSDDHSCFQLAIADARRLVGICPTWDHAWYSLGSAHLENGAPARAKYTFQRGLSACPGSQRLAEGLRDAAFVIESEGPESDWEDDGIQHTVDDSDASEDTFQDTLERSESLPPIVNGISDDDPSEPSSNPPMPRLASQQSRSRRASHLHDYTVGPDSRKGTSLQLQAQQGNQRGLMSRRAAASRETSELQPPTRGDLERDARERDMRERAERDRRRDEKRQQSNFQFSNEQPSSSAGAVSHQKLYELLQVPRTATEASIKRSYYKLARQYHPDKNRDDAQAKDKFQKVSEAYRVLSDPESRAIYDRYGDKDFVKSSADVIDPSTLFAIVFGSDKFVGLIGELQLASLANNVDEIGNTPSNAALSEIQNARIGKLALEMIKTLKPWVDGDKKGFLSKTHRQMRRLKVTSFGPSLLDTVGNVYVQHTTYLLDKTRPFRQLSAMMRKASLRSHRIASHHKAMSAAGRVVNKQKRLHDRVMRSGHDGRPISEEETRKIAEEMAQNAIDMMWKISIIDIESTLEEVLKIVLSGRDLVAGADLNAGRAGQVSPEPEGFEKSRPWLRVGSARDMRTDRVREAGEGSEHGFVRPGRPLRHGEVAITRQEILTERAYGIQAMGRIFMSALE